MANMLAPSSLVAISLSLVQSLQVFRVIFLQILSKSAVSLHCDRQANGLVEHSAASTLMITC